MKLVFFIVVFCLAVAFIVTNFLSMWETAATLEWTIAFIFSIYVFSFFVDLYPASKTKNRPFPRSPRQLEQGHQNGYTKGGHRKNPGHLRGHSNF